MRGIEDLSASEKKANDKTNEDSGYDFKKQLFQSPIFVSVSSTVSNTYETVKDSHEFVTFILNDTEDRLRASVDFISPYTDKVGSAICTSMEFLKKETPSIELPSNGIYDNLSNFIRCIYANTIAVCGDFFITVRDSLTRLSITTSETTNENDKSSQSKKTSD